VYVIVCSDHTDRRAERLDIALSKRACQKVVGSVAWRLDDVRRPLGRAPYPQLDRPATPRRSTRTARSACCSRRGELLAAVPWREQPACYVVLCGTVPTIGGIEPSPRFRAELHDPETSWSPRARVRRRDASTSCAPRPSSTRPRSPEARSPRVRGGARADRRATVSGAPGRRPLSAGCCVGRAEPRTRGSGHEETTVDVQRLARDVAGRLAAEVERGGDHVLGLGEPPRRNPGGDRLELAVGEERPRLGRVGGSPGRSRSR